jgi:hypothetical protein
MSFDYSGLDNTAKSLISKFGRSVTIRSYSNSGDEADPVRTQSDVLATAVVTDFKNSEVDGTLILQSDKKFLISSLSTPEKDDVIIDQGSEYQVLNVELINPGDTVLLYKAQGRL